MYNNTKNTSTETQEYIVYFYYLNVIMIHKGYKE